MTLNQALISETTLNATAASVTIAVPSGYTDLRLVTSGRLTGGDVNVKLYFNSDTTSSNYANTRLFGDGSSVSSDASTASQIAFATNISSYTASSYGSAEVYIPNYSVDGIKKSYTSDNVTESNSTTGVYITIASMLWQGTAPITSINLVPNSNSFAAGSTFTLYGISKLGVTPTLTPKATGGDIIKNDGTYWYHAFLSTGAFIPQQSLSADVLVVAGGGAGGGSSGGGGGAGGCLGFASQSLAAASYTVAIGAGGTASNNANGTAGVASQFGALTAALGGGYGGGGITNTPSARSGGNGASGGGGGGSGDDGIGAGSGGTGTSPGYAGGSSGSSPSSNNRAGGGGGGFGSAGSSVPTANRGGDGGAGVSTVTNFSNLSTALTITSLGVGGYIAGGGGGGARDSYWGGGTAGAGGSGGGGTGDGAGHNGTAGTVNTGSGGGGGNFGPSNGQSSGWNGGSGVVIIRYAI